MKKRHEFNGGQFLVWDAPSVHTKRRQKNLWDTTIWILNQDDWGLMENGKFYKWAVTLCSETGMVLSGRMSQQIAEIYRRLNQWGFDLPLIYLEFLEIFPETSEAPPPEKSECAAIVAQKTIDFAGYPCIMYTASWNGEVLLRGNFLQAYDILVAKMHIDGDEPLYFWDEEDNCTKVI